MTLNKECTRLSLFCRAFSNRLRLEILCFLSNGEKTVTEITVEVGASKHNVSQQLKYMRLTNILSARKEGRNIYHTIKNQELVDVLFQLKNTLKDDKYNEVIDGLI